MGTRSIWTAILGILALTFGLRPDATTWATVSGNGGDNALLTSLRQERNTARDSTQRAFERGDFSRAYHLSQELFQLEQELEDSAGMAHALITMGRSAHELDSMYQATDSYHRARQLALQMRDSARIFEALYFRAQLPQFRKSPFEELTNYREMLTYVPGGVDATLRSRAIARIVRIYLEEQDLRMAEQFLRRGLYLSRREGTHEGTAELHLLTGRLRHEQGNPLGALSYLFQSLSVEDQHLTPSLEAEAHTLLTENYLALGCNAEAKLHAREAVRISDLHHVPNIEAWVCAHLAPALNREGHREIAMGLAGQAMGLLTQQGKREEYERVIYDIAHIHAHNRNYEEALRFLEEYDLWLRRESMLHPEVFSFAQTDSMLRAENKSLGKLLHKLRDAKSFSRHYVLDMYFFLLIVLLTFVSLLDLFLRRVYTHRLQAQAEVIRQEQLLDELRTSITNQEASFTRQQKQYTQNLNIKQQLQNVLIDNERRLEESVEHMRNIQQSLLPDLESLTDGLGSGFIIYLPRDIVSGDFFWSSRLGSLHILTVVDCVGHGVPGAMMNLVGNMLLNKIVNEWEITSPAEILRHLHAQLLENLSAGGGATAGHYSMDLTVVCIDTERQELTFSSAAGVFFVIRNGEIIRYRGTVMSAGSAIPGLPFVDTTLPLEQISAFYLTSDGIIDQLNSDFRKLGWQRVARTMYEGTGLPVASQEQALLELLESHRGANEQTDDICVLGIQLEGASC